MAYLGIKQRKIIKFNSNIYPIIIKAAQLRIDNPKDWVRPLRKKCKKCNGNLIEREGKFGVFWGCSNFPKCRYTANL